MSIENPYASPGAFQDPAPVADALKNVRRQLTILGVLMLLGGMGTSLVAAKAIYDALEVMREPRGIWAPHVIREARIIFGLSVLILLTNLFLIYGGVQMIRRRQYKLCFAASVLMTIPILTPVIFLCIPFGIWALILLLRKDTRAAFHEPIQ